MVELWPGTGDEAAPYLANYVEIRLPSLERWLPDGRMYLLRDSPHVDWAEVGPYIYSPQAKK